MIKAVPEALASARELAQNWTWWHPLWFFIFFSMLVFRIRDVSEAKANPLDAYAMLRILPEAFVSSDADHSLDSEEAQLAGGPVPRHSGRDGDILPGLSGTTTAWSVNASWTAYKSLEFLADVSLLAAIVASAEGFFTYKSLVDWTLTFYGLSLVGVWINLPIWPTEGDGRRPSHRRDSGGSFQ